jgi:hypothetical protein
MDDLLRDTLRSRAADPTAACVDVETAAAFVDGTLSTRARSSAEAHIADCPRCQAVLAALVRSTPPTAARTWWRRPALAWLVPAAVAAGAVAIWINVPDPPNLPAVQMQSALPPPISAEPIQPSTAAPAAASQVQTSGGSDKGGARPVPPELLRARQAAAAAAAKASMPAARANVSSRPEARQDAAPSDFRMAAASAPAPAPQAPAPRVADVAEKLTIVTPVRATIVSSDRTTQWRIDANGKVEHSADSGASWETQETGTNLAAVAGSSPSSSVCWLVGRAGLVLITIDSGRSWRRLPFPFVTDLVSVRATDAQAATITSVDGRMFTTPNAGQTWQQ